MRKIYGAGIAPWNELRLSLAGGANAQNAAWRNQRSASVDGKRRIEFDREKLLANLGLQREELASRERIAEGNANVKSEATNARSSDLVAKLGLQGAEGEANRGSRERIAETGAEARRYGADVGLQRTQMTTEQRQKAAEIKATVDRERNEMQQEYQSERNRINETRYQDENERRTAADAVDAKHKERMASLKEAAQAEAARHNIASENLGLDKLDENRAQFKDRFEVSAANSADYNAMTRNKASMDKAGAMEGDAKASFIRDNIIVPEARKAPSMSPRNPSRVVDLPFGGSADVSNPIREQLPMDPEPQPAPQPAPVQGESLRPMNAMNSAVSPKRLAAKQRILQATPDATDAEIEAFLDAKGIY